MLPRMRADPREIAAIFAGGMIGALLRGALVELSAIEPGAWPWATFVANLFGALLLGYFVTWLDRPLAVAGYARPFLGTGFCGALTTFSAMQLELLDMIEVGAYPLAFAYSLASIALGLLAVTLGSRLVRRARLSR